MISVLIIVSGILWILFTQFDRSYEYSIFSPDLEREQSEIIQRIYQLKPVEQQDVAATTIDEVVVTAPQATDLPVITSAPEVQMASVEAKPELQVAAPAELQQTQQYNDVWSTFQNSDNEPYYFLKNNPWSPDYRPGY